ncbi:MAG TPA: hypothetical protein VJN95_05680 [Gemmatimonadales bacterium]|nr:hypothetical protein [Gemmatimonadales bacterium]
MSPQAAYWIVIVAGSYLAVGLVVALGVVVAGLKRIDPVAGHGTWGFRLLIVPGIAALWPLILRRVVLGAGHPPEESNAHREAARRRSVPQ